MSPKCQSILIVEDDESFREILHEVLMSINGVQIAVTRNGEEALRMLPKLEHPTLVILDWYMPTMGGAAFIEKIRKLNLISLTQIVVLTASNVDVGEFKVYRKPLELNTITEIFKTYCETDRYE